MPDHELHNEKALLLRVANGDEEAFAAIFRHYNQKIYSLALHLTQSQRYAEEIVQDVFLKIWLRQALLPEIGNFNAYLFVTARNHIYTYLKALAKHPVVHQEVDLFALTEQDTPEARMVFKEYAEITRRAIATLPQQQLEVFRLSREEHKTREQIAAQLKISPETVKVHLARAVRAIRAYIVAQMPFALLWCIIKLGFSGFLFQR